MVAPRPGRARLRDQGRALLRDQDGRLREAANAPSATGGPIVNRGLKPYASMGRSATNGMCSFWLVPSDGRWPSAITSTRSSATGGGLLNARFGLLFHLLKDIATEQDIKLLVDSFYDRVNRDEVLGPIFNDLAKVDWEHHLPQMYSFWTAMLFRKPVYKGQPWPKHMVLPLKKEHFERWICLFSKTVDEHFAGPKANEAKSAALSIADTFQTRFRIFNPHLFQHCSGSKAAANDLKLTAK